MSAGGDDREKLRERVAAEQNFRLYTRYSEKEAAQKIGWDYSTLKRKRRAHLVPFVDMGGGSIAYLGFMIADILLFGIKAREACPKSSDEPSNVENGGSAPSPAARGISAVGSMADRSPASASAHAILMRRRKS